jgi:hypothetical protein
MAPVCFYELYVDEVNRLKTRKSNVQIMLKIENEVDEINHSKDESVSCADSSTVIKNYLKPNPCMLPSSGLGYTRFVNRRPFTIRAKGGKLIRLYRKPLRYSYGIKNNQYRGCLFITNTCDQDFLVDKDTLLSTLFIMQNELNIKKMAY